MEHPIKMDDLGAPNPLFLEGHPVVRPLPFSGAPPLHHPVAGNNEELSEPVAACVAAMAGFLCSSSSAKEGEKNEWTA